MMRINEKNFFLGVCYLYKISYVNVRPRLVELCDKLKLYLEFWLI